MRNDNPGKASVLPYVTNLILQLESSLLFMYQASQKLLYLILKTNSGEYHPIWQMRKLSLTATKELALYPHSYYIELSGLKLITPKSSMCLFFFFLFSTLENKLQ